MERVPFVSQISEPLYQRLRARLFDPSVEASTELILCNQRGQACRVAVRHIRCWVVACETLMLLNQYKLVQDFGQTKVGVSRDSFGNLRLLLVEGASRGSSFPPPEEKYHRQFFYPTLIVFLEEVVGVLPYPLD